MLLSNNYILQKNNSDVFINTFQERVYMKKLILSMLLMGICSSSLFADRWIGLGSTAIGACPVATIKWVRVQTGGTIFFRINESSDSVPSTRIWYINGSTSGGKNILATLLTAQACSFPINFLETTQYSDIIYNADNITTAGTY